MRLLKIHRTLLIRLFVILLVLGLLYFVILRPMVFDRNDSEAEYYHQQLNIVKRSADIINGAINKEIGDKLSLSQDIDAYNTALLDGMVACEEVGSHVQQASPKAMAPYKEVISEVRLFCRDFEDVTDYALRLSRATKQFVVWDSTSLSSSQNMTLSVVELEEIVGYALFDLRKLSRNGFQDPASDELIFNINKVQKQIDKTQASPTQSSLHSLKQTADAAQANIVHARTYYWNNTIRITALARSVDKLISQFDTQN